MQNRIKELREKRNLTLDDVQIQTGINRGTFSNYENGTTEPKLNTWQKLADYFNVSVPYLQGLDQIWYPTKYLEFRHKMPIKLTAAHFVKNFIYQFQKLIKKIRGVNHERCCF